MKPDDRHPCLIVEGDSRLKKLEAMLPNDPYAKSRRCLKAWKVAPRPLDIGRSAAPTA